MGSQGEAEERARGAVGSVENRKGAQYGQTRKEGGSDGQGGDDN